MVSQVLLIGIISGVFLVGIGIGYAVFQANSTPMMMTQQQMTQMMNNPQMMTQWHQTMMDNPQVMNNWMNTMMNNPSMMNNMMGPMMNNPQLSQHMYGMMFQNKQFMQNMMNNTQFQNQWMMNPKLPSSDEAITPFEGMVTDYSSLVDAIKSRGVLVEVRETIPAESSSFSVPIQVISIGGEDIQIYEFPSEPDAQAASLIVSEDGTEIGTSIITWMSTPHFYTTGKLIVQYVGQNPEIMNLLESFLGQQFAGM
jgi:hypothetical protein